MFQRQGIILILSAASGSGKSTIANILIEKEKNLHLSISATTRAKREYEEDGKHYYFVPKEKFETMIKKEELIEYTHVFGNYYGTFKSVIREKINSGIDVILDIDYIGAMKVASQFPENTVGIFILPPSRKELHKRLIDRGDKLDSIENRMKEAKEQISHVGLYDYVIFNIDINESVEQVIHILKAERLKQSRLLKVQQFVETF